MSSHDSHDHDHDHDHDHGHGHDHDHDHDAGADVITISIIDFLILILCILILIKFIRYTLNKENYTFGQSVNEKNNLFRIGDIISLVTIFLYGITIIIVVIHDILHFIDIGGNWNYHFDLGITQWILFLMARIMLQTSFAFKLYSTFCGSALKYHIAVYVILSVSIIALFGYGVYMTIAMGISGEIVSPLSHNFAIYLIFTGLDFMLIMVIAFLFIAKLYAVMKLMNADSPDILYNNSMMNSNKNFLNAISKYSLLTTIISIIVIIQLLSLWLISVHYDHDDEVHVEYLQHCVSTVVIFIDLICLYLSCRLTKKLYDKLCKYPHKCCNKLCEKTMLVNYTIFNQKEIELKKMQTISSQSRTSSPTATTVTTPTSIDSMPNTPTT